MISQVQTGEPEPAVDYVHILQDIFAKRAPVSEDQFAEFYTEICDRVPWYEVVPGFLDPDRVPDECVIDVVWFVSNDTEHAFAAEEEAMRRFICSVLAYPGRISRERLHRVLQTKPGRAFGAPIVFREFPETDLSQISEQRVGDVISAMDMESFRSGGSKRVTVQPHRRPEVNMSADKTEPEPLDVLALVANRVPDAALLRTLSLVSHATAIASAGNAEWTRLFRARHPWVAELEGLASPLIESYEGEWTRGEVAQVAMRERVFKGDLAGIAPEVVEELQAEIASVEDLFASVLEEVQAMEGKDEGADGAASAAGPAVDTAMEEVEALEDLDISDSSDASDASSASTDSIAPVTPAEQLLHILGVIPSYLPAIHLLAFLLLLNGRFAESAKAAQIGIQLSGAEDKLGFRELELEATTRAASEDSAMDMEPEPHASSLSDPSNAPLFLSNKLLDALYSTFLRFSSSGTQLSAAEFGTVIQKTNGRSIPLKDIKGMVEGLEKGVEEVEGLREWVAEWLSRQPQPPAPLGPARSGVKGLSLAGWFLFFSRQLHTEDGEQETRADLEKLGWTEAL